MTAFHISDPNIYRTRSVMPLEAITTAAYAVVATLWAGTWTWRLSELDARSLRAMIDKGQAFSFLRRSEQTCVEMELVVKRAIHAPQRQRKVVSAVR